MKKLIPFAVSASASFHCVFATLEEEFMQALSSPTEWSKQKEKLNQALNDKKIDVNELNLQGKTFEEYDFSGMNFQDFYFIDCKFINVNLEKANLTNLYIRNTIFDKVKLGEAILAEGLVFHEKKSSPFELVKWYAELNTENKKAYDLLSKKQKDFDDNFERNPKYSEAQQDSELYDKLLETDEDLKKLYKDYQESYNKKTLGDTKKYSLNNILGCMRKLDLSRQDLSNLDLSEIILKEANLTGANLQETNLNFATLDNVLLESTDLQKTTLQNAHLTGVNLTGKNLSGLNLSGADLTEANLTGANLQGANLDWAILTKANLTDALLKDINLSGTRIGGARFTKDFALAEGSNEIFKQLKNSKGETKVLFQKLITAQFELFRFVNNNIIKDFNWKDFDFSHANLYGAQLQEIDLTGINLEGSNLTCSHLDHTLLINTNLKNTILKYVSFKKANLTGAQVTNADLKNTKFIESDLTNVNLTKAKSVEEADFSKARLSKDYMLPEKCSTKVLEKLYEGCQDEKIKPILKHLASNVNLSDEYFEYASRADTEIKIESEPTTNSSESKVKE